VRSLVILSGKGGVGKSSIAASLAIAFSRHKDVVCADCDVDASNLPLVFGIMQQDYLEWKPISTNQEAVVDIEGCSKCGICIDTCYFSALSMIDGLPQLKKFSCEGCGACVLVCPQHAIRMQDVENAHIGHVKADRIQIASAQLMPGNSGSGKVVFHVKQKAREIAPDADLMITDAAAGIGCPVIASVTGSDFAVLVTEPTPSGYSDMRKAHSIVKHFRIRCGIIVNKCDLDPGFTHSIEDYARDHGIALISKIPFDKAFAKAMTSMTPIARYDPKYEVLFDEMMMRIQGLMDF